MEEAKGDDIGTAMMKKYGLISKTDGTLKGENLLPELARDPPSTDLYKKYGVATKRGLKVKQKESWANRVADRFKEYGWNGDATDDAIAEEALQIGYLTGKYLVKLTKHAKSFGAQNIALAKAYKRFNYTKYKYVKKEWVDAPVGMLQNRPVGSGQ